MSVSGCQKAGELLLGTLAGVHLDSGQTAQTAQIASSHHNPVLKFNGTSTAENEDDNTIVTTD